MAASARLENGVYAIYSNPIGVEGGTIKPGGSMILDPFGEILVNAARSATR